MTDHATKFSRRRLLAVLVGLALLAGIGGWLGITGGDGWWGADRSRGPGPNRSASRDGDHPGPSRTPSPGGPSPSTGLSSLSPSSSGPPARGPIWRPRPGTTWQWHIVGKVGQPFRNVTMYDIDLTDAVPRETTVQVPGFGPVRWPKGENAGIVDQLHAAGKVVICYLDTGAWERYEPDAQLFPGKAGAAVGAGNVIGNNSGWNDEHWLDIRPGQREKFGPIIWARFDLAKAIGCDGVEPDQNNPYGNQPGFPVSLADQKSWYLEVARQAHARGLSVGMKNGIEVTDDDTVRAFDWNLNEECFFYQECDVLDRFVRAGKAVFQTEYTDDWAERGFADPARLASSNSICGDARRRKFNTLIKDKTPDATFVTC